ncbi:MAG: MG2 domain-containing protein [Anaerolineae bacterium]
MSSHVGAELLAYLDGELDARERARVEAHLSECAECAAELEQLHVLRQELDATFDAALTPVRLPAADRRIRERLLARTERSPWWTLWQRRGLLAQAALAVLVCALALNTTRVLRVPPLAAPQETLVLGQERLAPGSEAALRVIVRGADEAEPVAGAEVTVRIGRTPGLASVVYTGRTDGSGTAEVAFTVPEGLEGEASLVIETSSPGGEDRIVHSITVARDYKLFLSSDKPVYRPGQTIHLRALALDAVNLKPAAGQKVVFVISGPDRAGLEHSVVTTSDFGIAALDLPLPPDATHGQYTLQATLGDTVSERTVTVGAYELPAFRVSVETERTFYGPGERVTGLVQAEYFFGKPVASGQVTLRGYVGEPERVQVAEVSGRTDDEGRFEFVFNLPVSYGRSAMESPVTFDLEVEVMDTAGQREGIRRVLPIAAQPILVSAIPESGLLKPGVENVIFILTSYPDGQPAETALTVAVDGEKHALTSGPYGLAEFYYTPTAPVADLEISARDAQGAEGSGAFTFESDRAPQTLLLRAERAAYEVGETLRAEALVAGAEDAVIYLDVVRARQTIATLSAPVEDGRAVFALDLDGTMVGTLELHAYFLLADGSSVQDTRLVIVDAPRQVAVAVTADQEEYRPGDTAHLQFQTIISQSAQPVQTALGIGVVDESVYALEAQPPGFVRAYFLLEQELLKRQATGLDLPTLLDAEAEMQAAQDVAARAAWAGAQGTRFTLSEKSVAERREDIAARAALSNRLGLLLALLPMLLSGVVVRGLGPTGVLGRALRRVGIGGLVLLVASPLVALGVGGGMWLLWALLGVGAPVVMFLAVVALLLGLAVHGWLRRDVRVQLATGLLAAYLVLGGVLVLLAARGSDLAGWLLGLIALTFLLTVAALATLGQGLVLEGWRGAGWATTVLALLLIPLVVYLPFVPGLSSDLTNTLGNPALYTGPVGWLTGCSPKAAIETATVEAEAPAEEPPAEATAAPEGPAPAPTATPVPATPAPAPAEPFPLRQVFPETLYWSAESFTGEDGNLTLDLPLADNITTWRLTALASTREGELGVVTYDLIVFQDFFLNLDLPPTITQGDEVTVTVTLYNYLAQAQTVQIEPTPTDWYTLVSPPPQVLTLPPNDVATSTFSIRAERSGNFSLQVAATSERVSDAVAVGVTVEE